MFQFTAALLHFDPFFVEIAVAGQYTNGDYQELLSLYVIRV